MKGGIDLKNMIYIGEKSDLFTYGKKYITADHHNIKIIVLDYDNFKEDKVHIGGKIAIKKNFASVDEFRDIKINNILNLKYPFYKYKKSIKLRKVDKILIISYISLMVLLPFTIYLILNVGK